MSEYGFEAQHPVHGLLPWPTCSVPPVLQQDLTGVYRPHTILDHVFILVSDSRRSQRHRDRRLPSGTDPPLFIDPDTVLSSRLP